MKNASCKTQKGTSAGFPEGIMNTTQSLLGIGKFLIFEIDENIGQT
jgi:hypothetical protein